MSPFIILIFIVPGAIMFFLGLYIGKTGYVEVLKGYNEKLNYDRVGLTQYAKKLMSLTGLVTVVLCILFFILSIVIDPILVSVFLILYAVITMQYVIRLKFSCRKFEIKE